MFYQNHAPHARFSMKKNAPHDRRQDLLKKLRRRLDLPRPDG